jgi:hypothetical protein
MLWIIVPGRGLSQYERCKMEWFIFGGFLGGISITLGTGLILLRSMLEYNEAECGAKTK